MVQNFEHRSKTAAGLPDGDVVPALIECLSDRFGRIRNAAARGLASRGPSVLSLHPEYPDILIDALQQHPSAKWGSHEGLDSEASSSWPHCSPACLCADHSPPGSEWPRWPGSRPRANDFAERLRVSGRGVLRTTPTSIWRSSMNIWPPTTTPVSCATVSATSCSPWPMPSPGATSCRSWQARPGSWRTIEPPRRAGDGHRRVRCPEPGDGSRRARPPGHEALAAGPRPPSRLAAVDHVLAVARGQLGATDVAPGVRVRRRRLEAHGTEGPASRDISAAG